MLLPLSLSRALLAAKALLFARGSYCPSHIGCAVTLGVAFLRAIASAFLEKRRSIVGGVRRW